MAKLCNIFSQHHQRYILSKNKTTIPLMSPPLIALLNQGYQQSTTPQPHSTYINSTPPNHTTTFTTLLSPLPLHRFSTTAIFSLQKQVRLEGPGLLNNTLKIQVITSYEKLLCGQPAALHHKKRTTKWKNPHCLPHPLSSSSSLASSPRWYAYHLPDRIVYDLRELRGGPSLYLMLVAVANEGRSCCIKFVCRTYAVLMKDFVYLQNGGKRSNYW